MTSEMEEGPAAAAEAEAEAGAEGAAESLDMLNVLLASVSSRVLVLWCGIMCYGRERWEVGDVLLEVTCVPVKRVAPRDKSNRVTPKGDTGCRSSQVDFPDSDGKS